MYPPWLVLATTAAGVGAAQLLRRRSQAPEWAAWAASVLYIAKLAMLALPHAYLVLPVALLLLVATCPLLLYHPEAGGGAKRRVRLQPWQALLLHLVGCFAATALARFAVFDLVQWALMGRPPAGVLLGSLVMAFGASLAPLVVRCYVHQSAAARLLGGILLLGALLALLAPPLPRTGGAACPPHLPFALCPRLWDERHVPLQGDDDAAVWGEGLGRREHWPRWLLVAAAALGVAGMTGAGPGPMRSAQVNTQQRRQHAMRF